MKNKFFVLTINVFVALFSITSMSLISLDVAQAGNKNKKTQNNNNQKKKTQNNNNQKKKTQNNNNQNKKTQNTNNQNKKTQNTNNQNTNTQNNNNQNTNTQNNNQQEPNIISLNTDDLLNITTSGIWTSAEVESGSQNAVDGIGSSEISWGTPTIDDKQSSYEFEGTDTSLDLDGKSYLLGTFTHNNFPITGDSLTEANLALDFNIGGSSHTFDLAFKHDETPNTAGPNNSGYVDDIVSIPSIDSTQLFEIDGEMYELVISGFYQDDHLTSSFATQENQSNSAEIYGRLEKVDDKTTVPEPAAGLGLLAIGAIGTFKLKKRVN